MSRRSHRCLALAVVALLLASVAPATAAASASQVPPVVGAASVGDPFYPTLGNGGYDVEAYDLALRWTPLTSDTVDGLLTARAVVTAIATQDLDTFSLDLARANTTVSQVRIDGQAVAPGSDDLGRKLVLSAPSTIPSGGRFTVVVDYEARPGPVAKTGEDVPLTVNGVESAATLRSQGRGFLSDGDGGFLLAAQPNGAHTLFPSNDHPTDKALVTVRLTAPAGMLGVATGALRSLVANPDGSTTSVWASSHPVATHVLAMGVGHSTLLTGVGPGGLALRSSVPSTVADIASPVLDGLPELLAWLEDRLGAYPFEAFGLLTYPPAASEAILEGQTLVLVPETIFGPFVPACASGGDLVHEAAHQWFGDSVSLTRWDEKWLSEGHATFYEWAWRAEQGCDGLDLDDRMRRAYRQAQIMRDTGGPPAAPLAPENAYDDTIYAGGAVALYALRQRVGERTFEGIERAWLTRFADGNASTRDFIDLASEVSGKDLGPFLEAWLYGATVPAMPGHPGWRTVTPRPSPSVAP